MNEYYLTVMAVTLFFIWGLNYATRSDEILGIPADWLRKNSNDWAKKWLLTPLFDCPYCMPSVWGTLSFIFFLWGYPWYLWIIFVVSLTGLGHLFKDK